MISMLKKHGAALTFTPAKVDLLDQLKDSSEPLSVPEGLAWQNGTRHNLEWSSH
ncbi:hypothetical protein SOVF_025460 [Spinacia oleracea]|nr:hypothetical protein SOVF_025460 [Spinacia oleracea]